jgi:hypothetical protein
MNIIFIETPEFIHKIDAEIDEKVISVSDDENAWDEEISVSPVTMPTSIRLSLRTIQRAKFFARVHHERGYQSWLKKIVEERIDTEYELYKRLKKETSI